MKKSIVNHYLLYRYNKSITLINNNFKSNFRKIMMKCYQEWESLLLVSTYLTWNVRPKLGVQIGSVVSGDRQVSFKSTLNHPETAKRHSQGTSLPFGHNRRSDAWLEAGIWLTWNYWCSKGVCRDLTGSWALTLYCSKDAQSSCAFYDFRMVQKARQRSLTPACEKENCHRHGELSQHVE